MYSMHKTPNLKNRRDIFLFFNEALAYRKSHQEESERIALFVFDTTHEDKLGKIYDQKIEKIRNEFGALEAPGMPKNGQDADNFREKLWDRLARIVHETELKNE